MSDPRPTLLVLCNQCGLANRLKLMANAHALAAWCGARLDVAWEAAPGCEAPAAALFAGGWPSRSDAGSFEPGLRFVSEAEALSRPGLWHPGQCHPDTVMETLAQVAREPGRVLVIDAPGASDFHLPRVSPALLAQHKSAFYSRLALHPDVRERVVAERSRWPVAPGQPVVGLHVRGFLARHDAADALDFEAWSRPEDFLAVLAAFDRHHAFAVCTNRRDGLDWLWQAHPDGRAFFATAGDVEHDDSSEARDSVHGVREALVEWLLLGTCQAVVGTWFSSFSDEAALYGAASARYCPLSDEGLAHARATAYHARGFHLDVDARVSSARAHPDVLARIAPRPVDAGEGSGA